MNSGQALCLEESRQSWKMGCHRTQRKIQAIHNGVLYLGKQISGAFYSCSHRELRALGRRNVGLWEIHNISLLEKERRCKEGKAGPLEGL